MPMVDRISILPDEVLCHILSFLPTEEAVATSLFSRRWRPLWPSVPSLNFDEKKYLPNKKPYSCFRNFVYTAILARDMRKPIRSFRLNFCSLPLPLSDSELNILINAAIQRRIEILDIQLLTARSSISLRFCSFNCRTLVVLKLFWLNVGVFSSVDLPLLKTLNLSEVNFLKPQSLIELLCGCPNLEHLELNGIYCKDLPCNCEGEFETLTKLLYAYMSRVKFLDFPLKAICNTEFLRIYQFAGDIPSFSNLTHMELIFELDDDEESYIDWNWVLTILKQCPKLQIFVLELHPISVDLDWPYPDFIPECLSSKLRECSIENYAGTECQLLFVEYILHNSNVLRSMTICSNDYSSKDPLEMFKELSLCPRSSATCKLSFE
ncbi:Leucine-rich repeat 2 [Sesbania bispinosa]|nr:Leucine-rich repeat 2 [Sesbania bispinosa]